MNDSEPNPVYILVGAILLFGVLFSIHIVQKSKLREKQALGRPLSPVAPEPATATARPAEAPARNVLQKLLAVPFFGGWLATGFGILLPMVVFFSLQPVALKDSRYELLLMSLSVWAWNLVLTRFAKVRITAPLIPIPLSFVAFLFCLIGAWEAFAGS